MTTPERSGACVTLRFSFLLLSRETASMSDPQGLRPAAEIE